MTNLAQYCLTQANPDPDRAALLVLGPGAVVRERWSYGALSDAIHCVAAGLREKDLAPGARVLLRLGHSSDFPLMFFGAIGAGLVPVPTSAMLTAEECDVLVADSGAAVILHDGHTTLPSDPGAARLLGPDELAALKRAAPAPFFDLDDDAPAFLVYTSGTSGRPKGVLHAQRSARGRAPMARGWYGIGPDDRLLHAGAFNWTYTLGVGLMDPWANGATSLVYDGPRDPEIWPELLEASGATLFAAVPSLYRRILKYGDVHPGRFPSLRHGLTAGEALAPALHAAWCDATARPLYEALGMSEISTYVSSGPETPTRPGSPGRAQPGRRIAILGPDSADATPLPAGETGLLGVHRGDPGLMLRYWERPEDTAAAFRGDWFLTGDRASIDGEGYVWYGGRTDDVMNAFGYRVAPQEVEHALLTHPDVQDVAVTDVEAAPGVSLITAFVILSEGAHADETALAEHAAGHLAEYKRPKAYRFVETLPRTPSGKLRRKDLRSGARPLA
ncbi:class I adenylate-forming enzyme family protein [Stappia sp. ES.058]|uniref:class I adenylate-forming enzyme family protein n=1 Tax=Stappia sp. ES.058 TaxID=1881061 RepID=UPI00087C9D7B|nr:AMP-binding protein [Stappia sp. ES.058]SDU40736.1 Acyl-coenzyme A synthetase/AMP-(fatty) acid ligase [Stappia sp. ES.058]